MNTVCFYHKDCMDGKAAAAVVKAKYPDTEFYPVTYGDTVPLSVLDMADKHIYIVDFSFPLAAMKYIKGACKYLMWIDHHKTSLPLQEKLNWGDEAVVDMKECGATLTWKVLNWKFRDSDLPPILKYVRDRDLWTWELQFSREVSEALVHLYPENSFDGLLDLNPRDLIGQGTIHLEQRRKVVAKNCELAYPVVFHGYRGMAVNTNRYSSETGNDLVAQTGVEIAIMYSRENNGWKYSLRSGSDDVDVSAIAKQFGGGGHVRAGGFLADKLFPELNV